MFDECCGIRLRTRLKAAFLMFFNCLSDLLSAHAIAARTRQGMFSGSCKIGKKQKVHESHGVGRKTRHRSHACRFLGRNTTRVDIAPTGVEVHRGGWPPTTADFGPALARISTTKVDFPPTLVVFPLRVQARVGRTSQECRISSQTCRLSRPGKSTLLPRLSRFRPQKSRPLPCLFVYPV